MELLFGVFEFVVGSLVEIAFIETITKAGKRAWYYSDREQTKRRRAQNMQRIRMGSAIGSTQ